jgi:membrane-anchored mycosin MYCP
VVALIRSRYPDLTAGQVKDLIERTARTPGNGPNQATGYGVVDPVAALTYQLPQGADGRDVTATSPISGPPQPDPGNVRARRIVFSVTAACLALMVAAVAVAAARRRTR